MIDVEYRELINKISLTGNYIKQLEEIKIDMNQELENNKIDIKVVNILTKCIKDINAIYIKCGWDNYGAKPEEENIGDE